MITFGNASVLDVESYELNGATHIKLHLDKAPENGQKEVIFFDQKSTMFVCENDNYISYGIDVVSDPEHGGEPYTWSSRGSVISEHKPSLRIVDDISYIDDERGWHMASASTVDFVKKLLTEFNLVNLSVYKIQTTYDIMPVYSVMTAEQARRASLCTSLYENVEIA